MRVMSARELSAARRAKWQGIGEYLAQTWRGAETYLSQHYTSADDYRRATVRKCYPHVSDNLKGHIREGFNREHARHA